MQIYYKGRQQKSSIFYAKPDGRHGNSYRRNLFIVAGRNENGCCSPHMPRAGCMCPEYILRKCIKYEYILQIMHKDAT